MSTTSPVALPMKFDNLAHEALINVWWTGIFLKKEAKRFFRHELNSDAQFNILMILKYADEPLTQNDLSRRLLVDKSNITGLVDRMEKMALIRRNTVTGDRRRYHITLTQKGRCLLDDLERDYERKVAEIMHGLTEIECRQLIRLTSKIRQALVDNQDGTGLSTP